MYLGVKLWCSVHIYCFTKTGISWAFPGSGRRLWRHAAFAWPSLIPAARRKLARANAPCEGRQPCLIYQHIPLLSDWKSGTWGDAAGITGLFLGFSTPPLAFLGLRKMPHPFLLSPSPPYEDTTYVISSPVKMGSWVESEYSFLSCSGFWRSSIELVKCWSWWYTLVLLYAVLHLLFLSSLFPCVFCSNILKCHLLTIVLGILPGLGICQNPIKGSWILQLH